MAQIKRELIPVLVIKPLVKFLSLPVAARSVIMILSIRSDTQIGLGKQCRPRSDTLIMVDTVSHSTAFHSFLFFTVW